MVPIAAPPLRNVTDIVRLLEAHADLHALLCHVESLGLPDCWIGAGFIRNAVWDVLHGHAIDVSRLNDIDVIFFDPADTGKGREADLEHQLRRQAPQVVWSVKNQARMHLRNGDAPYRDTFDAIAHWAETATAVAARTVRGQVDVIAPYGVEDLLNLVVRPTPAFRSKMEIYRDRVAGKSWPARWLRLRLLLTWEEAERSPYSSLVRMDT